MGKSATKFGGYFKVSWTILDCFSGPVVIAHLVRKVLHLAHMIIPTGTLGSPATASQPASQSSCLHYDTLHVIACARLAADDMRVTFVQLSRMILQSILP